MATPTFDTIEAQASYGIGLQVGQQLSESGLQVLLPEAFTARCVKSTSVLTLCVASVFRPWPLTAKNTLMKTARKRV